ncbi:hypothetical protein [Streptomyces sp. NPDC056191]|uniref:hypothetical protein n=1 Tax=Streptomyces sp. NPDC056191 TaxID=3345742 RepID=UPI0035D73477
MPKTAPLTADQLVARYADDIAFAAEMKPATTVGNFIQQLDTAHCTLAEVSGISLADDPDVAAPYLTDAEQPDTTTAEKQTLLQKAADLMRDIPDAVDEYRLMS